MPKRVKDPYRFTLDRCKVADESGKSWLSRLIFGLCR